MEVLSHQLLPTQPPESALEMSRAGKVSTDNKTVASPKKTAVAKRTGSKTTQSNGNRSKSATARGQQETKRKPQIPSAKKTFIL
jgi:hypothetical protein